MEDRIEIVAEGQADGITVHAGFPNAAVDQASSRPALDLNQLLIKNPSSTYLFRVRGHQWEEKGIFNGDIAIIDRALTPRKTDLVLCWQNSNFVISTLGQSNEADQIWGVVTAIIHEFTSSHSS